MSLFNHGSFLTMVTFIRISVSAVNKKLFWHCCLDPLYVLTVIDCACRPRCCLCPLAAGGRLRWIGDMFREVKCQLLLPTMHFHANAAATDDIQEMHIVDEPLVQDIVLLFKTANFSCLWWITLKELESVLHFWPWTRKDGTTTYLRCLNLTTFEIAQLTSSAPDISIIFQQNPATAQVSHLICSFLSARDGLQIL